MVILEIPVESWFKRVNKSDSKNYFRLIYIVSILILISFFCNNLKALVFFIIILGILLLLMFYLFTYNTYIYKIEIEGDRMTLHYFKYRKKIKLNFDVNNVKIIYSTISKGPPFFVFQQIKPYKLLMGQGCYGYWSEEASIDVFNPYVKVIKVLKYGALF